MFVYKATEKQSMIEINDNQEGYVKIKEETCYNYTIIENVWACSGRGEHIVMHNSGFWYEVSQE